MTRPVLLLLAAIALIVAACGGSASSATPSGPAAPDHLAGTTWTVVSVNGRVSIAERRPTVSFAADQIQGNGGCNAFGGGYAYDAATGTLTVKELMSTLMGCVGPWGDFEGVFMAAFVGPLRTSMAADQLVLTGPKGVIVLVAAGA